MRKLFVAVLSLTAAAGSSIAAAQAGCCVWGGPVWPPQYNYDGYKPPPMYYRAYYGDYRPPRVVVHRRHWAHRRGHVVRSRG